MKTIYECVYPYSPKEVMAHVQIHRKDFIENLKTLSMEVVGCTKIQCHLFSTTVSRTEVSHCVVVYYEFKFW